MMSDIATYSPTSLATPVGERDDDITKIMDMGLNENNEVLYLVGYRNPNFPYSLRKKSEILDSYLIEIFWYYFDNYPNIGFVPNADYTERDLQYFCPQSEYNGGSQLNAPSNNASSIESSSGEMVGNNENVNQGLLVNLEGENGTNSMYDGMNVDDDSYDYINLQYVADVPLSHQNLFDRRTTNPFGTPNEFIDEGIHFEDEEQLTGEPIEGISETGTIVELEPVQNENTPIEVLTHDQTNGLDVSSSSSIQFDLIDLGASDVTVSLIGKYHHIQQDAYVEETSGNTTLEWENAAMEVDDQTENHNTVVAEATSNQISQQGDLLILLSNSNQGVENENSSGAQTSPKPPLNAAQSNNESQFNASHSEVTPRSDKPKNIFIQACESYDPNRGFVFEDYIHFGGFIGEFADGKRYSLCHKEDGIIILNEKQIPADVLRTLTRN